MSPSTPRKPRHDCLAVCTPGFEDLVAAELEALGIRAGRHVKGGVVFSATTRHLYLANVWLRTATRVLVRVASFRATSFRSLEAAAAEIDWGRWVAPGAGVELRVTSTKSRLYHTDAVAERVSRAAVGAGVAGQGEDGPADDGQRFVVRLDHDTVTISVDASGRPLYQRGWRGPQAKAPLRETSAAALLLAIGWDGRQPLVDPMCGSGTIPIEAAMIARGQAPGWQREFAFGSWPTFEPGTWASVAADAAARVRPDARVNIVASDRDGGAIDATRANLERAGVDDAVTVRRASISDLATTASAAPGERGGPSGPGWIVSNPPYGKRTSAGADLRNLFARLGQAVRTDLPGWSIALLVNDRRLAHHTGLPLDERLAFENGGLPVRLLVSRASAPEP